jgi:hypothetical protein
MRTILPINRNSIRNRTMVKVRGTIKKICTQTTGWWIFKETKYWLEINLEREDLDRLNKSVKSVSTAADYHVSPQVDPDINVFVPECEFGDFVNDEGANVILHFGITTPIEHCFNHQNLVSLMGAEFDPRFHQVA